MNGSQERKIKNMERIKEKCEEKIRRVEGMKVERKRNNGESEAGYRERGK